MTSSRIISVRFVLGINAPLVFIFLVSKGIDAFGMYDLFPWIDIPMHLIGGFFVAWTVAQWIWFFSPHAYTGMPRIFSHLLLIGIVAVVATMWEGYEFVHDVLFDTHMQVSVADTVGDLYNGIIGGGVYLVLTVLDRKRKGVIRMHKAQCGFFRCSNSVGLFLASLFVVCFAWYFVHPVEQTMHVQMFRLSYIGFSGMNALSFVLGLIQTFIWGYVGVGLWMLVGCCLKKGTDCHKE